MKRLKCESCGGNIEVDENQEFATCPYCKAKYQLNENKNIYIKLDDNTKELIENSFGFVHKVANRGAKFVMIPIMVFAAVVIIMIVMSFKTQSSYEVDSFNNHYEHYSGTKSKFFIESALDSVVTNNKTNKDHLITVVYNDTSITDPDKIVELKHSLENKQYEVKLDYDKDGYINKITLEDI